MAKTEKVRLTTPMFRMSYPNLFKARAAEEGGKLKYGLTAIFEPSKFSDADKRRWTELLKELDRVHRQAFGKPHPGVGQVKGSIKPGLRRNDDRDEPFEGFAEGAMFANITSDFKPGIVDINKETISQEEGNEDKVYPGCYARATVNVYSFDIKGKSKGVAIGLNNVQILKDGDRLDNRKGAADDFDDDTADYAEDDEPPVEDEDDDESSDY